MRTSGLTLFVLLAAKSVTADVVVDVHGDPISSAGASLFINNNVTASWTNAVEYVDVGITVKLLVDPVLQARNVTAYLTDEIGPGTTIVDEVAPTVTFKAVGSFPLFQPTVTLFQNLTLAPGTYYLTLSSDAPDFNTPVAWSVASHSTVIDTGQGVTRNRDLTSAGNSQDPFVPASVFSDLPFDSQAPLEYAVTGTPVNSTVPEPSPLVLSALGVVLAVWVKTTVLGRNKSENDCEGNAT
jgi:hypothetical protein